MVRIAFAAAAALAAVTFAGCSAKPPTIVPVEGVVLLATAPLPKVKVLFYPRAQFDGAAGYIAQGVTDDAGRVKLTCHGQDGACTGENLVVVIDEIPDELTVTTRPPAVLCVHEEPQESAGARPIPLRRHVSGSSHRHRRQVRVQG